MTAPRQDEVRYAGEGSRNPSLTASGGGYSAIAPLFVGARETRQNDGAAKTEGSREGGHPPAVGRKTKAAELPSVKRIRGLRNSPNR